MTNELLPSTAQVLPEDQRGLKPPQRTAAVLVALAVVVIVVAVVVTLVTTRDDSTSDEALFVLPVPVGDWQLIDGAVTEPVPDPDAAGTDERFIERGSLYGAPMAMVSTVSARSLSIASHRCRVHDGSPQGRRGVTPSGVSAIR